MEGTIHISSAPTSRDMKNFQPFDFLPPELICRISSFLGPRDFVQLRLVSKSFHGITYDPVIWKVIYANAPFPRPPGPFPFQSTLFLEQTLRRSERLAECWTTQPIQAVSSRLIRLEGSPLGHPRIIDGKWLLTFESYKQIVFYDVETRSRQVLCQWEDAGLITSWDACSVMSDSGLLVYVVFRENTSTSSEAWRSPWKLLEFRVHADSGHLVHSFSIDVPVRYFGQSVCLVGDKTPFLYIMSQHLVFDTQSRTFYEFPAFGSELDKTHTSLSFMTSRKVLLTNTHIIVASYCPQAIPSSTMESTLIQVFTLPHPASNKTGILRLSHEGFIPIRLANLVLARNSIINPITESTNLRFLRLQHEGDCLHFSSVDLTLPRSLSDIVLAVSVEVNDIFTVEGGVYDPFMSPYGYYMEASDDGHVRGFCRNRAHNSRLNSPWMTKFTVDATEDECVAAVGSASLPRWIDNDDPPCLSMLSFDGIIGRFCSLKGGHNWRLHGFVDVVIVDIK